MRMKTPQWILILLILMVISLSIAFFSYETMRQSQLEPLYYNQARLLTNSTMMALSSYASIEDSDFLLVMTSEQQELLVQNLKQIDTSMKVISLDGHILYDSNPVDENDEANPVHMDLSTQLHYDAGFERSTNRVIYTFPLIYQDRQEAIVRFEIDRAVLAGNDFWQSRWAVVLPVAGLWLLIWGAFLILYIRFRNHYARPLRALQAAALAMSKGDFTTSLPLPQDPGLARLSQSLDRMRLELADALQSKAQSEQARQDLVTRISHDLRTPVAAIKAYSEGLSDGMANDPERLHRYAGIIRQKTDSLSRLVDDLFEQSLLESGQLVLALQECYSGEFFSRVLEPLPTTYQNSGVTVRLPESIPNVLIRLDPVRIEQVLLNLVHNSVKYTPEGGIVRIDIQNTDENLQVIVSDTGHGVAPEDLPHIFDSFFRGNAFRRAGLDGAGLGLAICKSIIDQHGGRIFVKSQLGQGSRFCFSLPKS